MLPLHIKMEEGLGHGYIKVVHSLVISKLIQKIIRWDQRCWQLIFIELGAKIFLETEYGLMLIE